MACRLCGAKSSKQYYVAPVENKPCYDQCRFCGLIWLEERFAVPDVTEHYDVAYYQEGYMGQSDAYARAHYAYRIADLKRLHPASRGTLLEIGAAAGDFLALARNHGWQVSGIELSARGVHAAQEKHGLYLFKGTIAEFAQQYNSTTFDAVVAYHVLEHMPDPFLALRKMQQMLKHGGYCIVELPNPKSADYLFYPYLKKRAFDYPHHLWMFPVRTMERIVREAGFEIIETRMHHSYALGTLYRAIRREKRPQRSTGGSQREEIGTTAVLQSSQPTQSESAFKKTLRRFFPGPQYTMIMRKK